MKIVPFQRFNVDDYRNSQPWFQLFLDNMNFMVLTLNALLQRNIDIDNNLLAERQIVKLSHNVPITIKLQSLKTQASLVRVGFAAGFIGIGAITTYNPDGTLQVTVYFQGTIPTVPVTTTLIFEP